MNRSYKAGKLGESLYFLERMVSRGHKPNVVLCTKLIKAFFGARNIIASVKSSICYTTHHQNLINTYNAVINWFCKANGMESANRVLERMRGLGFSPDVVTYNIIIGSLYDGGSLRLFEGGLDEALQLPDEMLARGLRPNMYTCDC
ncbi:hypothetical protein MLD38_018603 [Melastoma candidum]|uniref:Uncharacterized protein n=1 Tax=Melastoma candidum TaxID=119954 RepID=A0ACB9QYD9_9MYRT|nr:hypothetical protein MLD38_018603 [Melastoma candidum]